MGKSNYRKVLKLNSKTGKVTFNLILQERKNKKIIKTFNEKETKQILKNFLEDFTIAIRKGFIKTIGDINLTELIENNEKPSKLSGEFLKVWGKNIPEVSFEVELDNGSKVKIPVQKDFISTSIKYQLEDKLKKYFLKEFKTFAIKNVPYIARLKSTEKRPYEKALKSVIKEINISVENKNEKKKYLKVFFLIRPFQNIKIDGKEIEVLLKVEFAFRLKNRDFESAVETSYKKILERIKEGIYKVRFVALHFKAKEGLSLLITYEPPIKKDDETAKNIMGVDLGQAVLAYATVISPDVARKKTISSEKDVINSKAFNPPINLYEILKKLWKVKKELQKAYSNIKEQKKIGLHSSASKRIRKDLTALSRKEKNLMLKVNEYIANEIIKFAIQNKVKIIYLENLKNFDKSKLKFPKWNYGQLQELIKTKADGFSIKVEKVNPKYTSIRCPKCEYVDKKNRPNRDKFKCVKCNFEPNRIASADFVGSLNIAFKGYNSKKKNKN